MDSFTINGWLRGLGRTYGELVSEGTILNLPLKSMFDTSDNEDLLQNPATGVKLWFWADTKRLKKVMITLIQTVGQPVYTGQLPEPFVLNMVSEDKYLPVGTRVRYDGREEGGPEYGIVVHCWMNDEMGGYDCYVAFFGDRLPAGKPPDRPYILRYLAASLTVVDA